MNNKYILNKNIKLRGWKLLPYALVIAPNNNVEFIDKDTFDILSLCNGKIDFDYPIFDDETRNKLLILEKKGAITKSLYHESLEEDQEYKYFDNRFIRSALFSITGRCNCKCKHCYMSANDAKYGELSKEEIFAIIDQLKECGIYSVQITGGECLVRSDFFEIVDKFIENDISISKIYSNGLLVNQKLLDELKKRNLHPVIDMSFDGVDGWHNWLRGLDYAFDRVDKAFKLCRDNGFKTAAEMCIHEKNKHLIRESINYLASVGCRAIKTCPVSDVGEWHKNNYGKSIEIDELFNIYLDYIPHYFEDKPDINIQLGGFILIYSRDLSRYYLPSLKPCSDPETHVICSHARNTIYISAEGRALPCMALTGMDIQNDYPLINELGLKKCLNDSSYLSLITRTAKEVFDKNDKCKNCRYQSNCLSGCRASALEFHPGNIDSIDEAVCKMYNEHWFETIDNVVKSCNPNCICKEYEGF